MELIDRYTHGDLEFQDRLNEDMKIYKNSEGDFGKRDAIREHNTIMLGKFIVWYSDDIIDLWFILASHNIFITFDLFLYIFYSRSIVGLLWM